MAVTFTFTQDDKAKRQALRMEKKHLLAELNNLKAAHSNASSVEPESVTASTPECVGPETCLSGNGGNDHKDAVSTGASSRIEEIKVMLQKLLHETLMISFLT